MEQGPPCSANRSHHLASAAYLQLIYRHKFETMLLVFIMEDTVHHDPNTKLQKKTTKQNQKQLKLRQTKQTHSNMQQNKQIMQDQGGCVQFWWLMGDGNGFYLHHTATGRRSKSENYHLNPSWAVWNRQSAFYSIPGPTWLLYCLGSATEK